MQIAQNHKNSRSNSVRSRGDVDDSSAVMMSSSHLSGSKVSGSKSQYARRDLNLRGPKGELVIDVPLPDCLRPLFHAILGQYLYASDSFTELMRKFSIIVFLAAGSAVIPASAWQFHLYSNHGFLADIVLAVGLAVFAVCVLIVFILFRMQRTTSTDGVILALQASSSSLWVVLQATTTNYTTHWVNFTLIIVPMLLRTRGLRIWVVLHVLLCLQSLYNEKFLHTNSWLLMFPDRRDANGLEPFVLSLLCLAPAIMTMIAAWFSFEEQQRQVRVAKASTDLAQRVVGLLRRYDTDKVQAIVERARQNSDGNEGLLDSFDALVENLEKYRPFLPNYLFLSSGDSSEDDHKEEVVSRRSNISGENSSYRRRAKRGGGNRGSGLDDSDDEGSIAMTSVCDEDEVTDDLGTIASQSTYNHQSVSEYGGAPGAGLKGADRGAAVVQYRGGVSSALVEVQCNEWFSVRHPTNSARSQRHNQTTFTDTLYDIANASKASIHSMVGDRVQLSWNATHRVAQPEAKAATFLLKLRAALAEALPNLQLAGACCSGVAEVHSVFSAATKQQALYIDAPWHPALECCFELAKQHQTLVVDRNTAKGAVYDVVVQAVDCIRFRPRITPSQQDEQPVPASHPFTRSPRSHWVAQAPGEAVTIATFSAAAVDPKFHAVIFEGEYSTVIGSLTNKSAFWGVNEDGAKSPLALSERSSPQKEAEVGSNNRLGRPPLAPIKTTLACELVSLKENREDDEWMYQLMKDDDGGDGETSSLSTAALMLALQSRFGEATSAIEHALVVEGRSTTPQQESVVHNRREGRQDCPSSTSKPPMTGLAERLRTFCHASLNAKQATM